MAIFVCSRGQNQGQQTFGFANRPDVSVTAEGGGLKVKTPYSARFVDELKLKIPATARKWDKATKCWYVACSHSDALKQLIDEHYGCDVQMPTVIAAPAEILEYTLNADYIANSKNGVSSIHCNGGWNAKIPEAVLRKHFNQAESPSAEPDTFYSTLGCKEKASPEEIKKAYKRAARQWHPDVCREPEARDMFEKIKAAYDLLSDSVKRLKYDAGLAFEKMAKSPSLRNGRFHHRQNQYTTFIPMLRCGKLRVRAKQAVHFRGRTATQVLNTRRLVRCK